LQQGHPCPSRGGWRRHAYRKRLGLLYTPGDPNIIQFADGRYVPMEHRKSTLINTETDLIEKKLN